jgi:hypothetical protein
MDSNPCGHCRNEIPLDWKYCPHCAAGLNCPNVFLAGQMAERAALDERFQSAKSDAQSRGCESIVREFEIAAARSQAVVGSTLQKLLPVVTRDRDVYATFHKIAELRFSREPALNSPEWDKLRVHAEIELLGSVRNIDELHYAALTLDGRSLPNYGEVSILLRENLISHRASVFQENSGYFVHRSGVKFPPGSRGTWIDRAKLCVAKLASYITKATGHNDFSTLLLQSGSAGYDDQFVEVHIFGPMTFATFEKVTIFPKGARPSSALRPRKRRGTTNEQALQDFCRMYNTECELA